MKESNIIIFFNFSRWEERLNKAVEYCRLNDLRCGESPLAVSLTLRVLQSTGGWSQFYPEMSAKTMMILMVETLTRYLISAQSEFLSHDSHVINYNSHMTGCVSHANVT